jgi:hypothetical protein
LRDFALKKGFKSRGGREDLHRAGNFILRMIVSGQLLLAFGPPQAEEIEEEERG